ncbi:MAG: YegS/Rv2252/BmrU family lipid kinase [Eubacteriales bacterium]|nr:YegS/Rv2252/BmrU family lipid kinase [Eubacteriales bacterium]
MLVVLGGDGTMNEVINGYIPTGCVTPIGYIPTGSTNDFAATLKLTKNPSEACKAFMKMNTRKIDIGFFNGKYFTYVAAAGAFTEASYATPADLKHKLGHFAYVLGGVKSLPAIKPLHLRLTVDGRVIEDEYLIALISNSTSVGGVFNYEESLVLLDDGKFEVALLKEPENANEFGSVLKDVIYRNYNGDYITLVSGSHILLESPSPIAWSLDGEYGGEYTSIKVENLRGALTLLV